MASFEAKSMDGGFRVGVPKVNGVEVKRCRGFEVKALDPGDIPVVSMDVLVTDGLDLSFGDADVRIDLHPLTQKVGESIACGCEGKCALDSDDVPTGPCKLKREIPKEMRHLVGPDVDVTAMGDQERKSVRDG